MSKAVADELDQFYTKPDIAIYCCNVLKAKLELKLNLKNETYLEPSAGTGVFIDSIRKVFGNENQMNGGFFLLNIVQ